MVIVIRDKKAPDVGRDNAIEYYLTFSDLHHLLRLQVQYRQKLDLNTTMKQTQRRAVQEVANKFDSLLLYNKNIRPATGFMKMQAVSQKQLNAGYISKLVDVNK